MKKFLKAAAIAVVALVLVAAGFVAYVYIDVSKPVSLAAMKPELSKLTPQAVSVAGVRPYTQPDGFTCGVTTVAITASTLNNADITPMSLIQKYTLGSGMKTDAFVSLLAKELPDYAVSYSHNLDNTDLVKNIHAQLAAGIPVPVFFGAANPYNKPWYDFHASVVTGLDLDSQQVTIANAYGFTEQVFLPEFLDRMSYRGGSKYPFVQRAVVKLGLMDKNAFVLITRK